MPWWVSLGRAWSYRCWGSREEDGVLCGWTFLRFINIIIIQGQYINKAYPCPDKRALYFSEHQLVYFDEWQQLSYQNKYRPMELKVDDLLEFCAYYTLAKTAAQLPHSTQPPQKAPKQSQMQSGSKLNRKKVEQVPKKTVKPKMEFASHTPKKSVSPIYRDQFREVEEDRRNKYDINYFVNHLTTTNTNDNHWNMPQRSRQQQKGYHKRLESGISNYQTFGRSANRVVEYQTFEAKMKNTQRTPLTDRYAPLTDRVDYSASQFYGRPESKIDHNAWMYPNQTAQRPVAKSQFIDIEGKRPNYYGPPPFEFNYQPAESKLTSSPNRRQFTPNSSNVSYSPSNLSKSRTKHQRKKSERPMYDPSKLTIEKKAEPKNMVENIFEQKNLTQSFISVDEAQSYTTYPRMMAEDSKRQTSTTAPPIRTNREQKSQARHQARNETDLDDALGQTLTELSHRQAPIALQVKMHDR